MVLVHRSSSTVGVIAPHVMIVVRSTPASTATTVMIRPVSIAPSVPLARTAWRAAGTPD